MPKIYYGTKNEPAFELEQSDNLIVVRTRSGKSLTRSVGSVAQPISAELSDGALVVSYPEVGVEVYRVPTGRHDRSMNDRKAALRAAPDVQFAGGVLVDPTSKQPVLYTENIFIKFIDTADSDECVEIIRNAGLTVKSQLDYATNAYFLEAPAGTGQKVFDIANNLLKLDKVEYCHPELIRPRARKQIFPQQWHLKKTAINGLTVDASANVAAAHEITQGEGVTIAVIDDGVDIDHPEFSGTGKIVAPRDATLQINDPRPKDLFSNHGTACAGVACANGADGASGVAPKARLIPIRLASGLGSQQEEMPSNGRRIMVPMSFRAVGDRLMENGGIRMILCIAKRCNSPPVRAWQWIMSRKKAATAKAASFYLQPVMAMNLLKMMVTPAMTKSSP